MEEVVRLDSFQEKSRMVRLGIDFGTTNIVVSLCDRGNYPITDLALEDDARLSLPAVVAIRQDGQEVRTGPAALECLNQPEFKVILSPKRLLGCSEPDLPVLHGMAPSAVLDRLLDALIGDLRLRLKNIPGVEWAESIQATIGVPANANSFQRYRTLEAFRRGGFDVLALVHEPTAAAIEYSHLHPRFIREDARHVLVYDLGGGTFDVSVVRVDVDEIRVLASGGIEQLGGMDFDRILFELALEKAKIPVQDIPEFFKPLFLRRACLLKESLQGNTKKVYLDLSEIGHEEAPIYIDEYFERCIPLIDKTIECTKQVLDSAGAIELGGLDALLLVGGGAQLPLVRRRLRPIVGNKLKISPHPFASTAVGLAIRADNLSDKPVYERFSRNFGVWREIDEGLTPIFDPIFARETHLPHLGQTLEVQRTYRPNHNIGHYRFEECGNILDGGRNTENSTPWNEIWFPFDPALASTEHLNAQPVIRTSEFQNCRITETYSCDHHGMITVKISRDHPPLERRYMLYQ